MPGVADLREQLPKPVFSRVDRCPAHGANVSRTVPGQTHARRPQVDVVHIRLPEIEDDSLAFIDSSSRADLPPRCLDDRLAESGPEIVS